MESYKVIKYSSSNYVEWNNFISKAKNATFLFHRDFMEYHNDRFEDYSLMIYHKDKLKAILPAHKTDDNIISHKGLTYGGLVVLGDMKFDMFTVFYFQLLKYLKDNSIDSLLIKEIPSIYTSVFTEEMHYLAFVLKAELIKRDTLSVIDLNNKLKISSNRLEGYKRGVKHELKIVEEDNFELFWNDILIKNLKAKHNALPVHSLEEITLLKAKFPNNIRQFNVYYNNEIVAGTTIFESEHVAHCQYISGNDKKNSIGSLDFLHIHLINETFKNKNYFDFGISNENNGLKINKGLQFWKEGFGARTLTQDFYKFNTNNYSLLNSLFI